MLLHFLRIAVQLYLPVTLGLISEQTHGLPNSCDTPHPHLNSDLIANHLTRDALCHRCPAVNCVLCGLIGLHAIDLTSAFGSKKFQLIVLFFVLVFSSFNCTTKVHMAFNG